MDIERVRSVIAQMTLAERLSLAGGGTVTASVDRLRVESVDFGCSLFPYAVNVPSELALGCTFSPETVAAVSKTRSQDAARARLAFAGTVGCGLMLDPMRLDASGCFSEDPYLASTLLCAAADGGVLGYVYTGALGQGEYGYRTADVRALREVYLRPFRKAGKKAAGLLLDGGYLGGEEVGATRSTAELLSAFVPPDAVIMTRCRGVESLSACGAYQLGMDNADRRKIARAVVDGKMLENKTARAVERIVATVAKTHGFYKKQFDRTPADADMFFASAVLLKNDGVLPADGLSVEIFGDPSMFDDGKCKVRPIKDAARTSADVAVFAVTEYFGGIPDDAVRAMESAAKSRRVVVALCGDCAAELPFIDSVNAVVFCPYFETAADIETLVKRREPRGRLPFTWCKSRSAYPANNPVYADRGDFRYTSVYAGHTYFDNFANADVLFPFGHGLGYTTFDLGKPKITVVGNTAVVSLDVKNVGAVRGTTSVQVYVTYCGKGAYGLSGKLCAFSRVELGSGESENVELVIDAEDLALFDVNDGSFKTLGGKYEAAIGFSSADIRARCAFKLDGEKKTAIGLTEREAPSYYATGDKLKPTAPEIEKLLKVPFVKKPKLPAREIDARTVKREIKRAKKTVERRLFARVEYKINNTPIE